MADLGPYLNQTATLERATGGYDYEGQPLAGVPETIWVRKEPASGVERSATGDDVDVETVYWTKAVVGVGDTLDGQSVRRVSEIIGKPGERLGCKAFV